MARIKGDLAYLVGTCQNVLKYVVLAIVLAIPRRATNYHSSNIVVQVEQRIGDLSPVYRFASLRGGLDSAAGEGSASASLRASDTICGMKMFWLLAALLLLAPSPLTPQQVHIYSAYMNAGEFPELPEATKTGYAMGFVNGLMASIILGAQDDKLKQLEKCTHEMQAAQVAAIIEKYIKEHPETWHYPLTVESWKAFARICPALEPPSK